MIAGLVVGSTGRTRMSPTTFEYLSSAWEQFGFWANSLIFLFAAMLIPKLMAAADWQELALVAVLLWPRWRRAPSWCSACCRYWG